MTDTSLYIYIHVKHFGMANFKYCFSSIGQEYELRLQRIVRDLNIPFRDEEHLRQHGFDKTPDIRLEIPFAVDGFIVNWIESKALFGDKEGHNTYFKDQYLSYWNR